MYSQTVYFIIIPSSSSNPTQICATSSYFFAYRSAPNNILFPQLAYDQLDIPFWLCRRIDMHEALSGSRFSMCVIIIYIYFQASWHSSLLFHLCSRNTQCVYKSSMWKIVCRVGLACDFNGCLPSRLGRSDDPIPHLGTRVPYLLLYPSIWFGWLWPPFIRPEIILSCIFEQ